MKTDVLIVGAGPTGLSLACQFVRYGIDFVILDRNEGVTPYSKAIGVQARTLEIFDQIGLAEKAVEQGTIAGKARLVINGTVKGEFDFTDIGKGLSPFPFLLMLEQSKTEQLLYEYIQGHGKQVLWKTELESLSPDAGGVTASVRTAAGSQEVQAAYVVGCDGPKSTVRHQLGITFEGSTFERTFYVADARIDWDLSHDALHICFSEGSFVIFFPLKGERRYRIVGVFPQEFSKDEGDILYEEIEARVKAEAKLKLDIHDVEWFSTYKVHTRHANRFSQGRGFVAGDAAHVHTPAGAQGMNTGIQDGYNLAWKLALVIRGKADESLLETYGQERLENAKRLLKTTDRMFEIVAGREWFLQFLRMHVLPPIAGRIIGIGEVRRYLFPILSQIGITYRHSPLSDHAGDGTFSVKAGDRMPYFPAEGRSVFDMLQEPKFHVLAFSDGRSTAGDLRTGLEQEFKELADVAVIPLYAQVAKIFGSDRSFLVLLRPDNHIACIRKEVLPKELRAYLQRLIGHP